MNNPNALLYKSLIINSFAGLLVYVAWLQGWLLLVFESDASYLSLVMAALFVIFWIISAYHIVVINREIVRFETRQPEGIASEYFNKLRAKSIKLDGRPVDQFMLASALRVRLMMPIHILHYESVV